MKLSAMTRTTAVFPTRTAAVFLALVLGAAVGPASAPAQHFPTSEELTTMIRYVVEDGATPGMVLGVVEADGTARVVAYGSAGPDGRSVEPGSVFEIGSVTKTFTATLLMDMVAKGEVALDDPVSAYLPDQVTVPAWEGREITLLDLATHTSGLPQNPTGYRPSDVRTPWDEYTPEAMYEALAETRLRWEPGSRFEYSNMGYGLLGSALARAAGTSLEALLRERILDPLGMDRTGYEVGSGAEDPMVQGHLYGVARPERRTTDAIRGAGGLRSTGEDLTKYLAAQLGPAETPLQEAMRAAREVRVPQGDEGAGRGLSWSTVVYPNERPLVAHAGSAAGFRAWVGLIPDEEIGLVWLVNSGDFDDLSIGSALLYGDPPPAEWRAAPGPAAVDRFVGTYEGNDGGDFYIGRDGDHLTYQRKGLIRARLYPRSELSFYMLRGPWTVTFRESPSGAITGLQMEMDQRAPERSVRSRVGDRVSSETPSPARVAGNKGFILTVDRLLRRAYVTVYSWGIPGWLIVVILVVGLGAPFVVRRWRKRKPIPAPPSPS